MNPLEFIEHFLALASGSFSSWPSITTNAITVLILFFARNIIFSFYVTLQGMNNLLMNITALLFMLSLYGIIYRSVSGAFKAVQQYRDTKKKKREEAHRLEALKNSLLNLSKNEIAILKFTLQQSLHSAWLPIHDKSILFLKNKGLISLISNTSKEIPSYSTFHADFFSSASLFSVPDNIRLLINNMPPEFSQKWRKIKPDWRLKDCQ